MELLRLLKKNKKVPMHMPGHKRNSRKSPYLKHFAEVDITEIEGYDNLHNPEGVLKASMEKAARLKNAKDCFYLVNGSTCGILAGITAIAGEGDKVIVSRNCHRSVYNAIELSGCEPLFVMPEFSEETGAFGEILPCQIEKLLSENPDTKLIVLTSPTYEGVASDIEKITKLAHEKNIPVLVDAAHGAHFGFGYGFPEDAVRLGADIVVESLHKTLSSLTQTALMYINGNLVDADKVAKKLAVFETSSPSYILLSSIDGCVCDLSRNAGKIFSSWRKNLDWFYEKAGVLENLKIYDGKKDFAFDRSKILIYGANGNLLAKKLREKGIEPEMSMPGFVLLMTGAGDTKKNFRKLIKALIKIDKETVSNGTAFAYPEKIAKKVMSPKDCKKQKSEYVDIEKTEGRISADYIFAYPPGVPMLCPGEAIDEEIKEFIKSCKKSGTELYGGIKNGKILVIK